MLLTYSAPEPFINCKVFKYFNKDTGRYFVSIINKIDSTNEIRINYAKYLMCIKEKRILTKDEEVDHINNNKLDDRIENLQILTKSANVSKSNSINKSKQEHGNRAKFKTGCRCFFCVLASRSYRRNYYLKVGQ